MTPAIAAAADWSVQSMAQVYAQAESNPQLQATQKHGAQSGVADVSLDLLRRTELLTLDLNAHGSVHRYDNDAGFDRDDQQVALAFTHLGERYSLGGNAAITRDTTLTSELGTTGITQFNQRHRARSLSLAPQWQLSERSSSSITLGWQDSTYANSAQSGLSDYRYFSAVLSNSLDISERTSALLSISTGRLDSARYTFDTDNIDVTLQVQHALSERWKFSIAGGPSRVRSDGRTANGSVFNTSLSYQAERYSLGATAVRSIAPNGSGLQSRRDELGLHASATLLEHVNATVSLSSVRSKDLVPSFGFTVSDVRYTRAELSLSWGFAQDLSLGLMAGNSEQKFMDGRAIGRGIDARMSLAWRHSPFG